MNRSFVVTSAALVALAASAPAVATSSTWSRGVSRICAHPLLFEGSHEIGTRAGAVAVAQDIRASTARRLARIAALPAHPTQPALAVRWLTVERHLAAVYANSYLEIFDVITAARTPQQQSLAAQALGELVHAPDRLSRTAAHLELRLRVPDCTGGTASLTSPTTPPSTSGPSN
jgi:hypothetical protein